MDMHLGRPATMPRSQQDTTPSTLMLHVLEGIHNIRNTAEAETAAETCGPCTRIVVSLSSPKVYSFWTWDTEERTVSYSPSQTLHSSYSAVRRPGNPQAQDLFPD